MKNGKEKGGGGSKENPRYTCRGNHVSSPMLIYIYSRLIRKRIANQVKLLENMSSNFFIFFLPGSEMKHEKERKQYAFGNVESRVLFVNISHLNFLSDFVI